MDKETLEAAQNKLMTNSTGSQKTPSSAERLSDVWVLAIFKRFQARWLQKWASQIHGIEGEAMREWGEVLAGLGGEDIKRGLETMDGEWPPTAYEFRELCKKPVTPFDGVTPRLPKPPLDTECGLPFMEKMRDKLK